MIIQARNLLKDLTPLLSDCGELCQNACCLPDGDGQGGVQLFPGEEMLYKHVEWAKIIDGILYCDGSCPRDERPMGCRIFPLTPFRKKDGTLGVRMDARAYPMCPLAPYGRRALDPAFVSGVLCALSKIDETHEGSRFLNEWMALERIFSQISL